MTALFSIKPQYAFLILSGTKRVEFRRQRCARSLDRIIIYATKPVCKVVGEVTVTDILSGSIMSVWDETHEFAGINIFEYQEYYIGANLATAFVLQDPKHYVKYNDVSDYGLLRPPQSFCYIDERYIR